MLSERECHVRAEKSGVVPTPGKKAGDDGKQLCHQRITATSEWQEARLKNDTSFLVFQVLFWALVVGWLVSPHNRLRRRHRGGFA